MFKHSIEINVLVCLVVLFTCDKIDLKI